ncbi:MAG: hypothetical protein E6G51_06470 [Actinobacteria bacterium]|nr:MAG: hypothetical protein E6G51_06470 [Actinomycetota bacterium]
MTADHRQLASGETIPVDLLRDFLGFVFQHDALRDVLTAEVADAIEGPHSVDALRFRALGSQLPRLVTEVLDAADPLDWLAVAKGFIENARGETPNGGDRP